MWWAIPAGAAGIPAVIQYFRWRHVFIPEADDPIPWYYQPLTHTEAPEIRAAPLFSSSSAARRPVVAPTGSSAWNAFPCNPSSDLELREITSES